MAIGRSLHIGINFVSGRYGDGQYPTLVGCDEAAKVMEIIARRRGYQTKLVTDPLAITRDAIVAELQELAKATEPGSIALITYAGHGERVPDFDGDEEQDQALVLYDRYLVDDRIYGELARFRANTRVVIVADSCYSGTIFSLPLVPAPPATVSKDPSRVRPPVAADVLCLSASRDTSKAEAAQNGGLPPFTRNLVWLFEASQGVFGGGYQGLANQLHALDQKSVLSPLLNDPTVAAQQPFCIEPDDCRYR